MSEWSHRFSSSTIWQALNELGSALDNAEAREGLEPQALDSIARLRAVLSFIGKRLSASDAFLIQFGPVDNAANQIQSMVSEVQQFVANGSSGHLANANSQADSALAYIGQLNFPTGVDELQGLKEAADKYRSVLEVNARKGGATVAALTQQVADVQTKLAELSSEMTAERHRLSSLASEFQAQFSTAQEARSAEFTSAQASRNDRFAEWQTATAQALAAQDTKFSQDREQITAEHAASVSEIRARFEDAAQQVLAKIQEHNIKVEKLVGVIGNLGLTSGYLKTANEAKYTARVWQIIAVLAMLGLIAVGFFEFLRAPTSDFTWQGFAGRVFFTLTVGVLAGYAAHQADRFMTLEKRNRILALELEALGPYLAPLPEEEQQKFRLALGDRTFGRDAGTVGADGKSPTSVLDMMVASKEFRAFIAEIVKAARGS